MNPINLTALMTRRAIVFSSLAILGACAAPAVKNPDADRVHADLVAVQSNPNLASRAPIAMKAAQEAVDQAEMPESDPSVSDYRVYIADRKVQTAKSLAQAQYAADQRQALSEKSDQIRLDSRTHEADAEKQKNDALMAQLADLKAKQTDHGVEINLGDVLFSSGKADLKPGSAANLDKLAAALINSPNRSVSIEGFTDNQGGEQMNMTLSQKRADAVSMYLTGHGVPASRVTAVGKGESLPVADNTTASGRQLNRRVVVTIQNPSS